MSNNDIAMHSRYQTKRGLDMNSRKAEPSRVLARRSTAGDAKDFLCSLANLQDSKSACEWLQRKFPDVMEAVSRNVLVLYRPKEPKALMPGSPEHTEINRRNWLIPLRSRLRAIWRAPDVATKEWGLFRISQDFFRRGDPAILGSENELAYRDDFLFIWEPPTRTERFLLALTKWAELLTYCRNPDCPAPYFIASRRGQDYCSRECGKVGQRESKRRWWRKNGRRVRAAD
jgi:hypothetical protein